MFRPLPVSKTVRRYYVEIGGIGPQAKKRVGPGRRNDVVNVCTGHFFGALLPCDLTPEKWPGTTGRFWRFFGFCAGVRNQPQASYHRSGDDSGSAHSRELPGMRMSVPGYKQTSSGLKMMSALPPRADIPWSTLDFRF